MTNPHKGSYFDSFLEEEGIKEELQLKATTFLLYTKIESVIKQLREISNEIQEIGGFNE